MASRIAEGYAEAIEWTLEFNRVVAEPELEKIMKLAANFSSNMLAEIEIFSADLYGRIQYALENHAPRDTVSFTLTLTVPDTAEFSQEMQRLTGESE